jgi:hypothetical protein
VFPPDDYAFIAALETRETKKFFSSAPHEPTASKAPAKATRERCVLLGVFHDGVN